MNIYTNSNYELAAKRKKKEEYRGILEGQILQKRKLKYNKQRFQTQEEHVGSYPSPRFFSLQNNSSQSLKTRKLNEQTSMLPAIQQSTNKRRPNLGQSHHRSHSLGYEAYGFAVQDTDIETMEALTECQVIIQNLRKLRLKSLSSMKRKQKQFNHPANSPQNYGGYSNRYDNHPKQRESQAQQQVMMFRAWQPAPNQKNKKLKATKANQVSQSPKKQKKKIQLDGSIEESGEMDEFQNPGHKQLKANNQEQQQEVQHAEQAEIERGSQKNNQQQEKKSKKQKFLLKYLAKAKFQGSKLHEKILQFKNKSLAIPKKMQIDHESVQNKSEENKSQAEDKHEKEEDQNEKEITIKHSDSED